MKKTVLFLSSALFAVTASFAQIGLHRSNSDHVFMGPVAGFGSSRVGNMHGSSSGLPSGYFGVGYLTIEKKHWGWGYQVILSSEGYKQKGVPIIYGNQPRVNAVYLRLPLRAYYFFGNYANIRPLIYAGPSVGVKMQEYNTTNVSIGDLKNAPHTSNFRRYDAGLHAGAGVYAKVSEAVSLTADVGYYYGLLDAVETMQYTRKPFNNNSNIMFCAGLLFGIR